MNVTLKDMNSSVDMKIELSEINSVIPYEYNTKIHSEDQINKIANSIVEFGFNQPIVIDENNIIIVGHGRFFAAKKLNFKTIPVVRVQLPEVKKKAYRILDNKLNEQSIWHTDYLQQELDFFKTVDFNLSCFDDSLLDFNEETLIQDELSDFNPEIKDNKYLFKIDCVNLDNLNKIRKFFDVDNNNVKNIDFETFEKKCLQ